MAKIKATTVLAHPETHEPVVLLEGTDCPDWAVDQITNPDVLDQVEQVEAEKGEPSDDWTVDELKAYAEEHDIDLAGATKKADVLKAVTG